MPYDVDAFAKDTVTFARTCLLSDELLNRFNTEAGAKLRPGDILMMEPGIWGATQTVYPFRANRRSRDEWLDKLRKAVLSYPRGKAISFGNVHFLSTAREQEIEFYKRKLDQPKEHSEIAAWVERHFDGRLPLHPKAVNLLADKSAQSVDAGLICDALDFLATDYWDNR